MKAFIASSLLLVLLVFLFPASLSAACTDCPGTTHICLDRGEGDECWRRCRWDSQCETGCCVEIYDPYTTWICGTNKECGTAPDGDETPVEPNKDCGETTCSSLEVCITIEEDDERCAAICTKSDDCESECCATIDTGQRVCLPEEMECPQSEDDGGGSDSNPFCHFIPTDGSRMLTFLFVSLLFLARALFTRRREERRGRK